MNTIWDQSLRMAFATRVGRLNKDAKPLWGKMNASGMMAHLTDSYRMALGELPVKPKNLPLRYTPIKQLIIYVVPFPKSSPTAPELLARVDRAVLGDEQRAFGELLVRLGKVMPDTSLADHPAFGALTYTQWGALMAKHTEHHLRQFGI
jgi:Protein of unknown function (DUF1569)